MGICFARQVVQEPRAEGQDPLILWHEQGKHAQHHEVVAWYGGRFGRDDIGVDTINDRIAKLALRGTFGKAGSAKRQNNRH